MQVTSMLSAGYLQPMMQSTRTAQQPDQYKQAKEQEILAEEQNIKARLGSSAEIHTVYQYAIGSDGKRYITGASITMKGTEEQLSRVNGGITSEDITSRQQKVSDTRDKDGRESEQAQSTISKESEKRSEESKDEKADSEKEAQISELKKTEREVIAHEAAHKAAAGEFGGAISYTYTEGPDGKRYITGGEVPIKMKQGSTPEETIRNMEKVQAAASAPADPSGQDRSVAARAAALAAKARAKLNNDQEDDEDKEPHPSKVAEGTPLFTGADDEEQDPAKNGVASVLAAVAEYQVQGLLPAA